MTRKHRAAALLMALVLGLVMLLSALYIIENADHDCVGDGCPVCERIAASETMLRSVTLAAAAVTAALVFLSCALTACVGRGFRCFHTPVSLKVKLSN
ncbi:MAG: hypothetical protein LUG57_08205 [Oscillospiraceae bacterium]|nr:hypothetical protein [Oscillospiraceae bacterium]